jgi:hypothetical protein
MKTIKTNEKKNIAQGIINVDCIGMADERTIL